jgi:hypothetical protein
VLNREGRPVAGISISVPRFRMKAKVETSYVEPLLRTTGVVSRILGYRPQSPESKPRKPVAHRQTVSLSHRCDDDGAGVKVLARRKG